MKFSLDTQQVLRDMIINRRLTGFWKVNSISLQVNPWTVIRWQALAHCCLLRRIIIDIHTLMCCALRERNREKEKERLWFICQFP